MASPVNVPHRANLLESVHNFISKNVVSTTFTCLSSLTYRYTMVMAMGYLTVCQVNRAIIFNYGILSTDFSG